MNRYLNFFIAFFAIQGDLYAAEAGMPQLDPKYWASQAFWLILVFTVLYFSISKFYLPKIKNNLDKIIDWKNLMEFIPKFYAENKMKRTGIAGIFAASLELTKEGVVKVSQNKIFDKLMIKKN